MKRRAFISLLGGAAAAWPLAAHAQQAGVPLVGFLQRSAPIRSDFAHFWDGLAALGYEAGRNIRIEQRYAGGSDARLHELVQDLTKLNPAVLVVDGAPTVAAVQAASKTIPIVSAIISDPERLGITNLAKPGGQLTGLATSPIFCRRSQAGPILLIAGSPRRAVDGCPPAACCACPASGHAAAPLAC